MAGYKDMSKNIMGLMVVSLIFSSLVGDIAANFVTASLQLSGIAATIVETTVMTIFVIGFMVFVAKETKLI